MQSFLSAAQTLVRSFANSHCCYVVLLHQGLHLVQVSKTVILSVCKYT